MSGETYHGSRERVSWAVTITDDRKPYSSTSTTTLFGEREDEARAFYERRAKYSHRGFTVMLERSTRVQAWLDRTDAVESRTKELES